MSMWETSWVGAGGAYTRSPAESTRPPTSTLAIMAAPVRTISMPAHLTANRVAGRTGTSTFNFNGGLLQAGSGAASDLVAALTNAFVQGGGACVNG